MRLGNLVGAVLTAAIGVIGGLAAGPPAGADTLRHTVEINRDTGEWSVSPPLWIFDHGDSGGSQWPSIFDQSGPPVNGLVCDESTGTVLNLLPRNNNRPQALAVYLQAGNGSVNIDEFLAVQAEYGHLVPRVVYIDGPGGIDHWEIYMPDGGVRAGVADWNRDGEVSVQDLFEFLASYAAGDTSLDIFDFLGAWFGAG